MNHRALIERLQEPSTYAGLAAIVAALGVSEPLWAAISAFVAAGFGLAAIVLREKGGAPNAE